MKRSTRLLAIGSVTTLGLMAIASGQNPFPEPTVESRIAALEDTVARLNLTLQMRTEAAGPQDRATRDFTLDQRLDSIERGVQALQRQVMDIERQAYNAMSTATQAQRDAQMAQQMARDVMNRVR